MLKKLAVAEAKHVAEMARAARAARDEMLRHVPGEELGGPKRGLDPKVDSLEPPIPLERKMGGGSDDIGDVSWQVPTTPLRFPSNMPNLPGHNWANGVTMATPIAHKGATAGAKVQAMTMLDFLLRPELVQHAWDEFKNVQMKEGTYTPLIRPEDRPAAWLNADIMAKYRPEMRKYYYDAAKYKTYLEQLGVTYPTVRQADGSCGGSSAAP